MRNLELLAPAGTMEALRAAVQNGCDAVYLGGSAFGARAFAGNFNDEEMIQAIEYAHIYGVKVYVTMNTLLYEDEIDKAMDYAYFLYKHDVDALIIQDLGFFHRLHIQLPELELHASTQMHIHNKDGIALVKQLGGKRVVLPRETSIEEIQDLKKCELDIEVFVHGALCVGYSGQCLMSSVLFDRSGNRGECAQPCRMKYKLIELNHGVEKQVQSEGDYLLSPKDLNVIKHMDELIDAGVTSFKIEGRMKRPEYVAQVVAMYRKAIDAHIQKRKFNVTKEQDKDLKKIFNRGFTTGHIFHQTRSFLMNPIRPNHMGVEVGRVVKATKDRITIQLTDSLRQGDGIRILDDREDQGWKVNKIYNQKGLLIKEGHAQEYIELEHQGFIKKGSVLLKTSDIDQLHKLQLTYEKKHIKIPVNMSLKMKVNEIAELIVQDMDGFESIALSEQKVEHAQTSPLSIAQIEKQLRKCGDSPFEVKNCNMDVDACFMSLKSLNQMRRDALNTLTEQRKQRYQRKDIQPYEYTINKIIQTHRILVCVENMEQYEVCLNYKNIDLYTKNQHLFQTLRMAEKKIQYHEGRVVKKISDHCSMSGDQGSILRDTSIADSSFNVTNSYTAAFLHNHNMQIIVLSQEHTAKSVHDLTHAFVKRYETQGNYALCIYGRKELMISEHCVVNAHCKDKKEGCTHCRKHQFYLEDIKGNRFPILNDENCRMRIFHYEVDNHIRNIDKSSISNYLVNFTLESKEEVKNIMDLIET